MTDRDETPLADRLDAAVKRHRAALPAELLASRAHISDLIFGNLDEIMVALRFTALARNWSDGPIADEQLDRMADAIEQAWLVEPTPFRRAFVAARTLDAALRSAAAPAVGAEPVGSNILGENWSEFALLLYLTSKLGNLNDGPFKDGFQTAIEEGGAYLDDAAGDGGDQAQTLMEQMCGLLNGVYALTEIKGSMGVVATPPDHGGREAIGRIPSDLYWVIGKGRTRPDEPIYGVRLFAPATGEPKLLAEAEGDDLVAAIDRAVAALSSPQSAAEG